ncbi:hypothetical protein BDV93DRAFT_505586 [Ceratobasidium sp. AG-I]|nr:hypothetical protein BDV93DRAFT_505586 [Ceratobasidium sp. AG-I]
MFTKIKKAKHKATKKAHHLADKLFGSSSEGVAEQSPSVSITDSGTRVAVATPVPASDSNLFLAPPASSSGARRTSVSQPTAVPLVSSSIDALLLSESKPDDLRVEKDPSLFHGSESASIASLGPERSTTSTAWSGLKTLIGLLNEGANKFGPLKSAFGEILGCIEIFERAAKGREDYNTLRGELDSLFGELSGYLKGPTPLAMTSSLENLAKYV